MWVGQGREAGQQAHTHCMRGPVEPQLAFGVGQVRGGERASRCKRAPLRSRMSFARSTGRTLEVESGDDHVIGRAIARLRVIGMEGAGEQQGKAQHARDPASDRRAAT
jgi:hypothetical protein